MYHFSDEINYEVFFRFDRKWIEDMNWAILPKASKAVLPVIAAHCNGSGEAFPSETTIGILAGMREKAVRFGVSGLIGFPGFELSYYVTKHGRRAKRFKIKFPPQMVKGRSFFFFKHIIEGGNWALLRPVSQALYPVMRYYGYFEQEMYVAEEDDAGEDFDSLYQNRKWDACETELHLLQELSGIQSRQSMYEALDDLKRRFLIEPLQSDDGVRRWKTFIKPPKRFTAGYLNKVITSRFICPKKTGHDVQKKLVNVQKKEKFVQKRPSK